MIPPVDLRSLGLGVKKIYEKVLLNDASFWMTFFSADVTIIFGRMNCIRNCAKVSTDKPNILSFHCFRYILPKPVIHQ